MEIIAETAAHHEGDFKFMHNLLCAIGTSAADIAKVHVTLDIDEYMTHQHSVYPLLKKWMFDTTQWNDLFLLIKSYSKNLMTLTNDVKSVEFVAQYYPSLIEIHAVALNDINLLAAAKELVSEGTKLALGVGGSSIEEIDFALNYVNTQNIILMFGFQNYPTNYADINFKKIRKIMRLYPDIYYGYADHTGWDNPNNVLVTLMGASIGMNYIEKHVSLTPGIKRADSAATISFKQLNELKKYLSILDMCEGDGSLSLNSAEEKYCVPGYMKKTAVLVRNIEEGEFINLDSIRFKRTGDTSDLTQLHTLKLLGKKASGYLPSGKTLKRQDFSGE